MSKKSRKERHASLKSQRIETLRVLRSERGNTVPEVLVLENDVRVQNDVLPTADHENVEVDTRSPQPLESGPARHNRCDDKVPWARLKLFTLQRNFTHAVEAARCVEEHDGNASDPYFTALLKSVRGSVPVPSHWHMLSEFLSKQADRDSASGVVPADIEATDIRELRASKDPKTFLNMNRIAFVRCFSVGTPLVTKTFGVRLTEPGDVFEEGRWYPKSEGALTLLGKDLREALGLKSTSAPPPWLYAMQHMKRLPPAFPFVRVPGMNAPIPEGAHWGGGEGMWGHAPRTENGSPSFPGVMGELRGGGYHANPCWQPWGSVSPPSKPSQGLSQELSSIPAPPAPLPAVAPPKVTQVSSSAAAPFIPTAFQMPMTTQQRVGPVREMEYTKTNDVVTGGLVAQGGVLLPRAPTSLISSKTVQQPSASSTTTPMTTQPPRQPPSTKF